MKIFFARSPRFLAHLLLLATPGLLSLSCAKQSSPPTPVSAARGPTEDAEEARRRTQPEATSQNESSASTAWDAQTEFAQLPTTRSPDVDDLARLRQVFLRLRDAREWTWDEMPAFSRRLPWLYPSDGCYVRTEVMTQKLREWGLPAPSHVFAFGNLSLTNPYETSYWWYHVAPMYRIKDQAYVLDPAVSYQGPIPLAEWARRIHGTEPGEEAQFANCGSGTNSPYDECGASESTSTPDELRQNIQLYLSTEWSRLQEINGKAPVDILGDRPPWLN